MKKHPIKGKVVDKELKHITRAMDIPHLITWWLMRTTFGIQWAASARVLRGPKVARSGQLMRDLHPINYFFFFFNKLIYLFINRSLSCLIYKLLILPSQWGWRTWSSLSHSSTHNIIYITWRLTIRHKPYRNPSLTQTSKLGGSLVILTCLFSTQLTSWWEGLLGSTQDMSWGRSRKREI